MSSAIITLLGFYSHDHTLFDSLDLPEDVDKQTLVDTILLRGGEYEVMYSNPDLLKELFGSWSRTWKPVFSNWLRANESIDEVAPLENYDRIENWSDSSSNSENESLSTSESVSSSESSRGSSSTSGSDSSSGSESLSERGDISAYDSSGLVANNGGSKSAQSNNNATTFTQQGNTQASARNNSAIGSQNRNKNYTDTSTHGGRIHGNIGVTTSAKMYQEWYDVLGKYGNIYEAIATVFLQAFVIPIL